MQPAIIWDDPPDKKVQELFFRLGKHKHEPKKGWWSRFTRASMPPLPPLLMPPIEHRNNEEESTVKTTYSSKAVTLDPARKVLETSMKQAKKTVAETLLETSNRDYNRQRELLIDIQAYQMALDVLNGKVTLNGDFIREEEHQAEEAPISL